jgi:linoleoyl-CoA desaturase
MSRPAAEYLPSTGFHEALKARVDEYFARSGLPRRDDRRMGRKAALILSAILACYVYLVFGARGAVNAVAASLGLAVSIGALGFSVAHDANHGAFAARPGLNRLMALMYDAIGANSYIWRWKHNVLHHGFPNIPELDEDIQRQPLFRLTPSQAPRPAQRFQHLYAWPLYGLLVFKWQLASDFRDLWLGRTGPHPFERPSRRELGLFWLGKGFFALWAFGIPLLFHPLPRVLGFYALTAVALSLIMSTVFQLAHCFDGARSARFDPDTRRIDAEWARHQVESSADFCRDNRLLSWYVGGLNFQTEHHLFPAVSHVHYPALARIVEATCAEYGVRYTAYSTLAGAVASHARWLRRLGAAPVEKPAPSPAAASAAERIASS